MTARASFRGWRERATAVGAAGAWLALFSAAGIGLTLLLEAVIPAVGGRAWWLARNGLAQLVGFAGATVVVGYWLNRHSWERMGWRFDRGLPRRALRGTAIGMVLAGLAMLLALATGGAVVHRAPGVAAWPGTAGPLGVGLLAAALAEELWFRGYPLRRLAEAIGPVAAIAAASMAFGVAHLGNPNASIFSTLNIVLAGVWLSLAFFSPGGMPFAWGLHFGWNSALALVFDAPVSGYACGLPGLEYVPGSRGWIDGGRFGPEGGLVGTVALAAGVLIVLGRGYNARPAWLA